MAAFFTLHARTFLPALPLPAGLRRSRTASTFRLVGWSGEFFRVVTRTDGTFENTYGEAATGYRIVFLSTDSPDHSSLGATILIEGTTPNSGFLGTADIAIQPNTNMTFRIRDTGSNISVFSGASTTPLINVTATEQQGGKISLYNRELNAGAHQTDIDAISVYAIPEPSSVAYICVGSLILLILTLRNRVQKTFQPKN